MPLYDPSHPAQPSPPTLRNRFTCLILSHFDHLDYLDNANNEIHLICLRCSRILVRSWPMANVENEGSVHQY